MEVLGVQGSRGLGLEGFGFRGLGLGFSVWGLGCRVRLQMNPKKPTSLGFDYAIVYIYRRPQEDDNPSKDDAE